MTCSRPYEIVGTVPRFGKTHSKHHKLMELSPAAELLEFAAIELLALLKKTACGNTFILVIAGRLTTMTSCIPLRSTTAATVTAAFLECGVYTYGAPQYTLTDSEK